MNRAVIVILLGSGMSLAAHAQQPTEPITDQDWGHWGNTAPTTEANEHADSSQRYGTGIAGSAENLLHQLDQSYLLDYQKTMDDELDFEVPPGSEIPDEIIGTQLQGGDQ